MIDNKLMSTIVEDFYMTYVVSGHHGDIYPKYGDSNLFRKDNRGHGYNHSSLGPIGLYWDAQTTNRVESKIYYYDTFYNYNMCNRRGGANYYNSDSLRKSEDIFQFVKNNYKSPQIKM